MRQHELAHEPYRFLKSQNLLQPAPFTSTDAGNREHRVEQFWFTLHRDDEPNERSILARIWFRDSQVDSILMRWDPFEAVATGAVKRAA